MNAAFDPAALDDCDREPIHQIGSVQDFGGLIALDEHWHITHFSDNCADLLGIDANPTIGSALAEILIPDALEQLKEAASRINSDKKVEQVFGLQLCSSTPLFDCAIHASGRGLVLEFEPHSESYDEQLKPVGALIARLSGINDLAELCDAAVEAVRELTGYDRAMVYKFRRDDSGEVIAESAAEGMEPYLGLRYPREDIPLPARALFLRNRVRVLADVAAEASPIRSGETNRPLDLSLSVLRASAPVHLQYLRNMGVAATLTIAIIRQGKLWGLISCHHNTPKRPPYALRTVVEMFSQVFSLMLDRILVDVSESLRARAQQLHNELVQRFDGDTTIVNDIPLLENVLRHTIAHDGMSLWMDDEYRTFGEAPSARQFAKLIPELSALSTGEVFTSVNLSEQIEEAQDFADTVTGALALPISRTPRDYLVLWRKPLAQTVRWGGEPAKVYTPGTSRLEPRSSFAAWSETVEGQSEEWSDDELVVAEQLRLTLIEVVLRMTDEIARERRRAQEQQELLIAELNHRVRNILHLTRSLVMQSEKEARSVTGFATLVGGRIAALASAHDNITREKWSAASLLSLVGSEFAAYVWDKQERFCFSGKDVMVKPEAYTVLALVIHELVTNSVKYGAMSGDAGSVEIALSQARAGDLNIAWRERGGPPVTAPKRRSFGSIIIERSIPFELQGEAELRFETGGVEADFTLPARYLEGETAGNTAYPASKETDAAALAAPRANTLPERVLVVEDNMIIALSTEDSLADLGVAQIDLQSTVAGTLAAIAENPPDFAIIDYNLGTESSLTITKELAERKIDFVLATGYSEMGEQLEGLGASGMMQKPYGTEEIAAALSAFGAARR